MKSDFAMHAQAVAIVLMLFAIVLALGDIDDTLQATKAACVEVNK